MWDEFFHEPTAFEEQVEEFKESLRAAVREEIVQEMDDLRKENESLRAIRDDWNGKVRELEQDYSKKKSELDDAIRKARYAESEAKKLRFNELVAEVAPVVWSIEYRTIHLPKCDLCDEHRYRQYTTPLGRISKEPCTCAATKEQAYAKRVPILKIYGLDRQNELRPYYLTCDAECATYRDSYEFFDDTPFEDISRWRRPLFHDEARARRYAAWLNKKEGLT